MAWNAKNYGAYNRSDQEAIDNGQEVLTILYNAGWSFAAIAGFWGNVEYESGYNPWRWESDIMISSTDSYNLDVSRQHGYGLGQFTPASKYVWNSSAQSDPDYAPNYSDRAGQPHDGASQVRFIDQHADYIPTSMYPISYADYKVYAGFPEDAASIWVRNYERPADPSATEAGRRACARYWFDLWGGVPPGPTPTDKKFKLYLYGRNWQRRQRR